MAKINRRPFLDILIGYVASYGFRRFIHGDSFCQVDLRKFLDFHINKKALLSIVLANATNSQDYGIISLGDSQRIVKFDEKAKQLLANIRNHS
jgi:NDP-sugar pyrophosphorylase family protein